MKIVFTLMLLLISVCCFSQQQDVYFLKNNGSYVRVKDSADYIRVVSEPDSSSTLYSVEEYYLNGKRKLTGMSSKINPPVFEGECATFYKSGSKQNLFNYKNGLQVGVQYEFYPNGKLYMLKIYPDNNDRNNDFNDNYLIEAENDSSGTKLVENGNGYCKEYDNTFKLIVEQGNIKNGKKDSIWKGYYGKINTGFTENYKDGSLIDGTGIYGDGTSGKYTKTRGTPPQFKGGLAAFSSYLSESIIYPTEERQKNIQGRVIITFVVEKDGKVTNIKVLKSVSHNIDNEATRVIENCPKWIPGMQFGRPVRVAYSVPLNFVLNK